MDVNATTTSAEVKSEGLSKTKRTYVIGVVDTTGMKSVNANRKRRWDQPPDIEGDHSPPKVRGVDGESSQPDAKQYSVVCEEDQDITEDYDSQYEECVGSKKVVADSSLEEPSLEEVNSTPVSEAKITEDANESLMDSKMECSEEPSLVDKVKPDNLPPLPTVECPPNLPAPIEGSTDHAKVSIVNVKDNVNQEPKIEVKTDIQVEEKIVAKPNEAVSVTGIISDSLKQIQFCYDEDSNSTEESEVETKVIDGNKTDVEKLAKEEDVNSNKQLPEQRASASATVDPSEQDTRRSLTPVLSEEQDEQLVAETVISQEEPNAVVECKTDTDIEIDSHSIADTREEVHDAELTNAVNEPVREKKSCSVESSEFNKGSGVHDSLVDGEGNDHDKIASSLGEHEIRRNLTVDSANVPEAHDSPVLSEDNVQVKITSSLSENADTSESTEDSVIAGLHDSVVVSKDQVEIPSSLGDGEHEIRREPTEDSVNEPKVQCQSSLEQELEKKLSDDENTTPATHASDELLSEIKEDSAQSNVVKDGASVSCNEISSKTGDFQQPDNEFSCQENSSVGDDTMKETEGVYKSNSTKPVDDSMVCDSEPSLSKDSKMSMDESSDKYSIVIDDKVSGKGVGQNNLVSMDNSQNCVGFDELNNTEKVTSKSANHDLQCPDTEEELKANSSEVTMHFASFRTPENAADTTPERVIENVDDESFKALDVLPPENPDKEEKDVKFQEPISSMDGNTMEMLDSLVRRSSEDDPSRVQLGEGILSEDSLINEINQLPDKEDDEKQIEPDHEGTSEALVESISPNDHESTSKDEVDTGESKKTIVEVTPEAFENVDLAATANLSHSEKIGIVSGDVKCKPGDQRNVDKPEGGMSVEDELSQGGEEESKNMNVSSENIIEVIFGSKQENNIHTIGSMERDGDSKATEKNDKDSKIAENSLVDDVELKTCSDSNDARKSVDDSKLQLNNEEIEIDNTEIVMVDPTKPLSGEDSDNDADERPSNKRTSATKEAKACLSLSPKADVTPSDDGDVPPSNKSADLSIQPKPKSKDVEVEELMEVEESNTPGTKMNKTVIDEPMDVDEKSEMRSAVSNDNTATMKAKNEEKPAPMNEVREPSVPVLIIKKQALSSKKDGDKKTMETLLTCSPKSTDNLVSDTAPTPSQKKVHNEALQIDTTSESTAASFSPKHSPITLRIYKDNLTVKTDLDSPKRNKSPMSSEFKSELSPKLRSPGVSENLSPQNKPLEFTLKIAKDAHTNFPKATMSPKNVSSPNSVWKSEVQITDSPTVNNKEIQETKSVPQSTPTRGRGRGRGRGATPKRGAPGRGRRGGFRGRISSGVDETSKTSLEATEASSSSMGIADVIIKQEVLTEDEKSDGSSVGVPIQMHDMYKKVIKKEADSNATPDKSIHSEVVTPRMIDTPIVKKRGRPRKSIQTPIVVPEEIVTVKNEPMTPGETLTPVVEIADGDDGSSSTGRPKRTCRGRTKPIVVKKRKPRGGGAVGAGVPRGASTPLPPIEIKEENATPTAIVPTTAEATTPESTTLPTVTPSPPTDKSGVTPTPPARGRGGFKRPTPDRNTLSEKELAELQKIEAKKEKLRLDRIAKYEAKKAKKLAKKLKDEERRKRLAREKAEKAEAAAPQVFEEETRMSAPDSSSIGQTPGQQRFLTGDTLLDESQNSISTPGDTNKGNKKGRMEICITDMDCLVKEVRVDELAEYQWQGSELYMIQEQVSLYLGVKSFKRKYPGLKRRPVEAEERTFLEDSGLVPKSMCDLGLTAVGSAEILDIMFQDFPEKYEEFRKHVRDKQAREASFKQKAAIGLQRKDGTKVEPREQALEAVAAWNANLNRERREERRCALDLQTFTVHYPKLERENMKKHVPKVGLYPVAVIPGQFCDHYKKYTPNELMYFPVNTVLYGPLRPNERQKDNGSEDGSGSESSSSSSSSSSSGESSSESESEGDEPAKCKMCNGTKKRNKDSIPEVLLTCVQCKACYHPTCKEFTPEMIIHLTKYEWQCTACKKCSKCRDPNLKDRIMCCQLCDRGYHLSCIGLKKMPEGRWHCTICAYCSSCGSRNPGGSDWQHEFKKGEKGIKIYQRTLCTPCFKLWRKGKYCQLCSKCHSMKPEEDPNLIQCNSCDRWLHKECYGSKYGLTNKLMSTSSIQCDFCVERITLGTQGLSRSLIKV